MNTNPPKAGEEKIFLLILVILTTIIGLGSWFAAAAFAHRDHVRGILPDHPRSLINFSLTNSLGNNLNRDAFRGKFLVVSFLFTSCSLTCPEVTKRMADIQRLTAGQPDVLLVSLTVDPRSDTPSVLANWGERYGADTNRWLMLTGDKTIMYSLIATSFLPQDAGDPFNSMPGNFTGTERIAIVDRRGNLRCYFDGLRLETPAAVVAEIAELRKEK